MKGKPTKSSPKRASQNLSNAIIKSIAALVQNEARNRQRIEGIEAVVRNLAIHGPTERATGMHPVCTVSNGAITAWATLPTRSSIRT